MDAQGLTSSQRKLVMWYKVTELKSKGLHCVQIAHELGLHRHTVEKYVKMTLEELRQLAWLNQAYNLILMGPSGTGKTYIASGLIYDALKAGKKAYMISMEDILTCLRTKDISMSALTTYNKWLKADLLAIDDIMLFPVKKEESASFFNLVNSLHEKTSVIITTNKAPTEWVQTLNDEVLATAIIDRAVSLRGNQACWHKL